MKTETTFSIVIRLTLARWDQDVATNATKRQGLVEGLLVSNKASTDTGYELAMQNAILNFPANNVTRVNDSYLMVAIGSLPTYNLPPLGNPNLQLSDPSLSRHVS